MDLRRFDLNLLVAFDALMTERNVTAAGRSLSVGQSAMSSSLSRLRLLLNDPVLERRGRAMVPTPVAVALTVPVREALARFDKILTEAPRAFDPNRDHRQFTVMASEYAALSVLQPLLVALANLAPNVELRIEPLSSTVVHAVATDSVDLSIFSPAAGPADDALHQQRLYADHYVVAVDAANPYVADAITLKQFSSMPYLASGDGHSQTHVDAQLDRLGVKRRLEVTTGLGLAPYLLRDTRFVTLLPSRWARTVASGARLKLLEPPMPLEPIVETMVWAPRNEADPGHSWLRDRLIELVARFARESVRRFPL